MAIFIVMSDWVAKNLLISTLAATCYLGELHRFVPPRARNSVTRYLPISLISSFLGNYWASRFWSLSCIEKSCDFYLIRQCTNSAPPLFEVLPLILLNLNTLRRTCRSTYDVILMWGKDDLWPRSLISNLQRLFPTLSGSYSESCPNQKPLTIKLYHPTWR
jgi:hypothetical protein